MVSECDSTSHLLEDLLLLARGDVFPARIELLPINITTIVKEVSQRAASLASAKEQQIELHVPPDPIVLLGDNGSDGWSLGICANRVVETKTMTDATTFCFIMNLE